MMSLAWMIFGFLCFLFGVYSKKGDNIESRCACIEENGIPMLNKACGQNVIEFGTCGNCHEATGEKVKCLEKNNATANYIGVHRKGKVVWVKSNKVIMKGPRQCIDRPPAEFRGLWMATVHNIDWPSSRGLSSKQQQQEMMDYINIMYKLKMNALVFQIRPEGDAFYKPGIEPWSRYLTGKQGEAPDPLWDPLQYAIDACHSKHIEVHAWFNPFMAKSGSKSFDGLAPNHMAVKYRKYAYPYGYSIWMDPGAKVVQNRIYDVIMDVISRYDIDGVHWDDFFYPYPYKGEPFPDNQTYNAYTAKGGRLSLADWRRNNVNTLVQRIYNGIKLKKRKVKFGISPFGLFRPGKKGGMPHPIRGFDQYDGIYADPKLWLHKGWVDYLTPQIYWRIDPPQQSYPKVLKWWLNENPMKRHLYSGNGAYLLNPVHQSHAGNWKVSELQRQVNISRSLAAELSLGNIFFDAKVFKENVKNVSGIFMEYVYTHRVDTPYMPWLHQ